ncbi:RagB/SusD family nutrient uptake outer membrane protein [Cytophagaceae bacterium YF14B1]|uniref:RagB/SusD family nutrient uptake outer membrane protein n=1 Tax=Xanthocytophaga flava TaxID=3048013 RepID=A0AAE3QVZ6_9BACT|nr:RagB/SusD family nutrient uptake outer membrane protein [Xanthocytophaga flavus]MDJ1484408.1 RagB/SusD family nutrient uptake outer membrane protein [Xanthocytophaga flavus]
MKLSIKKIFLVCFAGWLLTGCQDLLNPKPNNILSADIVLTSPDDVPQVRIGLYNALRSTAALSVVAGDLTADLAIHNGTFTVYNELSNKRILSTNSAAATFWAGVYNVVYIANFIEERLPGLAGVSTTDKNQLLAEARLLRGYAYFIGANTFGGIPLVTTTDVEANSNIGRSSKEEILAFALEDITRAIENLPDTATTGVGYATKHVARAMLARYYLYQSDWVQAEQFATQVINSKQYSLEPNFSTIVAKDFTSESILEVGYTITDDPGTSTYGLNNIFVGRREVIPANSFLLKIFSEESGDRNLTVSFDASKQRGNDNGFSVAKYGTSDEDNNNIVLFRLGEMYLIRAEARARQGKLTGTDGAITDINVLRTRAKANTIVSGSQSDLLTAIENERLYELAFEGHRWYDLVRTGRANTVMTAFSSNWKDTYNVWPVPQTEIQRNPGLRGSQNPGY